MDGRAFLDEIAEQYRRHRRTCERAVAQVADGDLFRSLGAGDNSIAALLKHLAGNHRSRFRDFLSSDGEKPDRRRDEEFLVEGETREAIERRWRESWEVTRATLEALSPGDLERTITIRGEPLSVVEALQRSLTHLAYHTGQIVLLARHFAGESWQTLSIAPGKSEEFNAAMRERHGAW